MSLPIFSRIKGFSLNVIDKRDSYVFSRQTFTTGSTGRRIRFFAKRQSNNKQNQLKQWRHLPALQEAASFADCEQMFKRTLIRLLLDIFVVTNIKIVVSKWIEFCTVKLRVFNVSANEYVRCIIICSTCSAGLFEDRPVFVAFLSVVNNLLSKYNIIYNIIPTQHPRYTFIDRVVINEK